MPVKRPNVKFAKKWSTALADQRRVSMCIRRPCVEGENRNRNVGARKSKLAKPVNHHRAQDMHQTRSELTHFPHKWVIPGCHTGRMCGGDGVSFNLFCTSTDFQLLLWAKGCKDILTSPNGIKNWLMVHCRKIMGIVKSELNENEWHMQGRYTYNIDITFLLLWFSWRFSEFSQRVGHWSANELTI